MLGFLARWFRPPPTAVQNVPQPNPGQDRALAALEAYRTTTMDLYDKRIAAEKARDFPRLLDLDLLLAYLNLAGTPEINFEAENVVLSPAADPVLPPGLMMSAAKTINHLALEHDYVKERYFALTEPYHRSLGVEIPGLSPLEAWRLIEPEILRLTSTKTTRRPTKELKGRREPDA